MERDRKNILRIHSTTFFVYQPFFWRQQNFYSEEEFCSVLRGRKARKNDKIFHLTQHCHFWDFFLDFKDEISPLKIIFSFSLQTKILMKKLFLFFQFHIFYPSWLSIALRPFSEINSKVSCSKKINQIKKQKFLDSFLNFYSTFRWTVGFSKRQARNRWAARIIHVACSGRCTNEFLRRW
jgi:hypothetical protein